MTTALTLARRDLFNGLELMVYTDEHENLYMTREQIGQALEYANPRISIANIHNRRPDRLDPLSGVIKLITPGGIQEATVYTLRGCMEICRLSDQPNADAFMDKVWNIMEGLYRGELELVRTKKEQGFIMEHSAVPGQFVWVIYDRYERPTVVKDLIAEIVYDYQGKAFSYKTTYRGNRSDSARLYPHQFGVTVFPTQEAAEAVAAALLEGDGSDETARTAAASFYKLHPEQVGGTH